MTSLLFLSLALAAAEPVAEPAPGNEITVIAQKLRGWRGKWTMQGEAVSCTTRRSTGDRAIDAIGCDAVVECVAPIAPQLAALEASDLPGDEVSRRVDALREDAKIGACVVARRDAAIAALAEQRRRSRT